MSMRPFSLLFPELAKEDARALLVRWPNGGLPVDTYVLVEHFCATRGCDCRRALLGVIRASTRAHVATLAVAFGTGGSDGSPVETSLDPNNPQSELSNELLTFFVETCASDLQYTRRLAAHYTMWRQVVEDTRHPAHGKLTVEGATVGGVSPDSGPAVAPSRIPPAYRQWGAPRRRP